MGRVGSARPGRDNMAGAWEGVDAGSLDAGRRVARLQGNIGDATDDGMGDLYRCNLAVRDEGLGGTLASGLSASRVEGRITAQRQLGCPRRLEELDLPSFIQRLALHRV
jgi:hypothetical protein